MCEAAGVELETVPLTKQYWDRVVSYSVSEIREGRTPNPDMLCNSRVKFGENWRKQGHDANDARFTVFNCVRP